MVDCDWPWSVDVRDFVEAGDNKGALLWKSDDDEQLATVEAHFAEKIELSRTQHIDMLVNTAAAIRPFLDDRIVLPYFVKRKARS